jgi:D-lactate dehydrogenase (cytochrome)
MTIENALIRLADAFGDQFSTAAAVRDHHGQNESYFPVTPGALAHRLKATRWRFRAASAWT